MERNTGTQYLSVEKEESIGVAKSGVPNIGKVVAGSEVLLSQPCVIRKASRKHHFYTCNISIRANGEPFALSTHPRVDHKHPHFKN